MLKAGFISLGCAKNRVDTEVMLGILEENSIEITNEPSQADILIVNTCSFIESAREEAVTTILGMSEYKDKTKGKCRALIIAGCLGQRYGKILLDEIPEADAVIGTGAWDKIMDAVNSALSGDRVVITNNFDKKIYQSKTPRIITTPIYSAYVKIAEGCNHRCAFCSIPLVRGNYRSRKIEDIVEEVNRLVENGTIEINLIAQDTTNYGMDNYKKPMLPELLRRLVKIEKLKWLRIQYTYPHLFTDELIDVIASEDKICKYVDIPLQHADNNVLKRMRRADTKEYITELLEKIRKRIPSVSIRTTFIVGFPGETDEEYKVLRDFVEKQRFDKVGIFTYSREENTPGYDMPNQVPEEVMEERYHDLMSLQGKISEEINDTFEGKNLEVLVEGHDLEQENVAYGRSYREAPEVDGQIYIEDAGDVQAGDLIKVKVMQGFVYDMVTQRIEK